MGGVEARLERWRHSPYERSGGPPQRLAHGQDKEARITKEIDMEIDDVTFYTDSIVVLGYINSESRRFYVYVANRVQLIRKISSPSQWRYVDTSENPAADLATRSLSAQNLAASGWMTGPSILQRTTRAVKPDEQEEILLNEDDPEVRKEVLIFTSQINKCHGLGAERFSRFSSLSSLPRAIASLIVLIKEFKRRKTKRLEGKEQEPKTTKNKVQSRSPTAKELQQAMAVIIKTVQEETFSVELKLQHSIDASSANDGRQETRGRNQTLRKSSTLFRLDPFIDSDGILRLGGRLRRANMEYGEKHPVLLPKDHHVANLVVRHYHGRVHHQGRQITHGAIRQAGYWLIGGNGAIVRELSKCVVCKKLRGPVLEQRMADLPSDRTEVAPPFTNVGFDVFGPWTVNARKTRGGIANSKRWGLVFTCLRSFHRNRT